MNPERSKLTGYMILKLRTGPVSLSAVYSPETVSTLLASVARTILSISYSRYQGVSSLTMEVDTTRYGFSATFDGGALKLRAMGKGNGSPIYEWEI